MISQLPPVGTRLRYPPRSAQVLSSATPIYWVNSGTAALALALLLVKYRNPEVSAPKVCIPGYGCPDMVSAAMFAGFRPVLVDIAHGEYRYQQDQLEQAIDNEVLAVITPSLLGLPFRLTLPEPPLEQQSDRPAKPQVIHDCAQWLPEQHEFSPRACDSNLSILSMSRGKPVNLMGGGAMLSQQLSADESRYLQSQLSAAPSASPWQYWLKAKLLNLLLQPLPYGLLSLIPGLKLGETHYYPLEQISGLDSLRSRAFAFNAAHYLARDLKAQQQLQAELPSRIQLESDGRRLLRFPLLLDSAEQSQQLLHALRRRGLGGSAMYQRALHQIEGVAEDVLLAGPQQHAEDFAARLVTLPLHSGVKPKHLEQMIDTVNQLADHDNKAVSQTDSSQERCSHEHFSQEHFSQEQASQEQASKGQSSDPDSVG